MRIDAQGLLVGGDCIPSPNFDERPAGAIDLLVIHNISLPPDKFGGDGVQRLFTNTLDAEAHPYYRAIAGLKVSAHFFIRRDGRLIQFVPCSKRAWHAGISSWQGRERCNDFSIGVELEGCDTLPFTDLQYEALHRLTLALRATYPLRGIAGHSDIAPQRKTDPGPHFDWLRYLSGLCEA
ncbi:N-acetyl-anhydromuranmyl-L-alanine amidase [Ferrigenium kumadai]|uniref:1,6-anhydro-N-acetylmuramyl-L-alanine amidase AmpD n=1 Tax=Ferrigenium kumadai TaxID=1682490 RepID=A0AAN1T0C2_9PROT|nr:1,6-anhydro-N-acetylmuramyl-L-alanine amidase AmpD [Ferrigenium kumadai]BBJ00391.1 N-acetyl-anhydromuranmyl-L-alanine amidase [Ferrigenium kumadai]